MKIKEIADMIWVCFKYSFVLTVIISIPIIISGGIPWLISTFVDSEIIMVFSQGFCIIFGGIFGISLLCMFFDYVDATL